MVLRTTGASWLTLMMRAESARGRAQGRDGGVDTAWLLYGPDNPDVVEGEDEEPPEQLLAAE